MVLLMDDTIILRLRWDKILNYLFFFLIMWLNNLLLLEIPQRPRIQIPLLIAVMNEARIASVLQRSRESSPGC